ncbi:hypothetical protein [Streptomyces sp. GSL17-113]|uniref:hypothetical protein n=1 Tax=Streptomyces sp. GSL17-113 TaxID=3115365 RepID=UPI002E79C131|nr:hypothetical protein [Streptomyces sp. GSL17-113]
MSAAPDRAVPPLPAEPPAPPGAGAAGTDSAGPARLKALTERLGRYLGLARSEATATTPASAYRYSSVTSGTSLPDAGDAGTAVPGKAPGAAGPGAAGPGAAGPDAAGRTAASGTRPHAAGPPPSEGSQGLAGPGGHPARPAGRPGPFAGLRLRDGAPPGERNGAGHAPPSVRSVAAAVCLVLGVGLLGGAGAGVLLTGDSGEQRKVAQGFDGTRAAWHEIPVDDLFPRTLRGNKAGPGGADRRWTRVAVAPDSGCAGAFDPLLAKALAPVGCGRLLRATYTDETTSSLTTVGLLFTKADPAGMRDVSERFATQNLAERTDLMPRPYAARGTVAADFGDAQRASWTVHVQRDIPVVVYSVSGFADGRTVTDPQPADEATLEGETSPAAQAGLGHDAQGIADRVEKRLRKATTRHTAGTGGGNEALRAPGTTATAKDGESR